MANRQITLSFHEDLFVKPMIVRFSFDDIYCEPTEFVPKPSLEHWRDGNFGISYWGEYNLSELEMLIILFKCREFSEKQTEAPVEFLFHAAEKMFTVLWRFQYEC